MKTIAFRADASEFIGAGHVMRCLTLADEFRTRDASAFFICREMKGDLRKKIRERDYDVKTLAQDCVSWQDDAEQTLRALPSQVDCLVVDHYHLDAQWEKSVRQKAKKILAVDDLANRPHDCDFLLDQNFFSNAAQRYHGLVPQKCRLFLGPNFALLRPQFHEARKRLAKRNGQMRRVLISFGGGDASNETEKALLALQSLPQLEIDVVLGPSASHQKSVEALCDSMKNAALHVAVENMADLMVRADLAIGGSGTSAWERCYLGLPSLVMILAENQENVAVALDRIGVIMNLGWHHTVTAEKLKNEVCALLQRPETLKEMSRRALELMPENLSSVAAQVMEALHEKVA
ncbi:MAG: UDP-2,4-diacetamido-2,4,6-trideoxy-beta-L-altropyranose hydrolase [bacterium]